MNHPTTQFCENCLSYSIKNEKQGYCCFNPPTRLEPETVPNPDPTQAPIPLARATFPTVFNTGWCRKWEAVNPTKSTETKKPVPAT